LAAAQACVHQLRDPINRRRTVVIRARRDFAQRPRAV